MLEDLNHFKLLNHVKHFQIAIEIVIEIVIHFFSVKWLTPTPYQ